MQLKSTEEEAEAKSKLCTVVREQEQNSGGTAKHCVLLSDQSSLSLRWCGFFLRKSRNALHPRGSFEGEGRICQCIDASLTHCVE
jgi:putative methionine-R-sulfoxide reductase with GAF domain